MKNWMSRFIIFLFLGSKALQATQFPLNHLKFFVDGLNIEGGTIAQKYLQKDQIWANLCVVLDRPFEDGIEWQELTDLNTFPLKEAAILDYNEAQVNFAYATVIHHYLTHAHQIANKSKDRVAKILIQVHRNTSGPRHIELLQSLIQLCFPELQSFKQYKTPLTKYECGSYFFPKLNVELDFCFGTAPENLGELKKYEERDIVLSFSLVAGLHPDWGSGSLLVADRYTPFSLNQFALSAQKEYSIKNHLKEIVCDLVAHQNEEILKIVNQCFGSLNSQKQHMKAKKLSIQDFKEAHLLQVDGLFNPSQLPSHFKLHETQP